MATTDDLDWSIFDDEARRRFVAAIDETIAATSEPLQRATKLAAMFTEARFAQLSLIGSSQFVPASHGLTYSADQQHSPIEASLCSVTMASRTTLVVENAAEHPWVRSLPPVTSGAVGSYLGVPLVSETGYPIGALCAFDPHPREWDDDDRSAIEDLACLVTHELHLQAQLHTSHSSEVMLRQIIADMVDRPTFNQRGPLRATARYRVASNAPAGGDWLDYSTLDDGERTTFGIGDVAGHGLSAVVTMDDLRHTLRAFAMEGEAPGEVIRRADAHLRRVNPGAMATAMKFLFHHATGVVQCSSAGHPPPVIVVDGRAEMVRFTPNPPLGAGIHTPRSTTFDLPVGGRLVLVTDGVFERRRESITESLDRFVGEVLRTSTLDLDGAADALSALHHADNGDDACVLVVDHVGE